MSINAPNPKLASLETKELIAEVRRRRGTYTPDIDDVTKLLEGLDLGALGALKRQIDAMWDHRVSTLSGLTPDEKAMLANRDFMGCVKSVRERLSIGLADAKFLVDRWKGGS